MWNVTGPGIDPASPALVGRFFPTGPQGCPTFLLFLIFTFSCLAVSGLSRGAGISGSRADSGCGARAADAQPHWMQHLRLVVSQQVGS